MTATAIAVLGITQRGSAQFSSVSRLGGSTRIQVGLNFSVMSLTAASGAFLATTVTATSNQQALPTGTINVVSTTGFPASGTVNVTTSDGVQQVAYTGKTATSFTGCTGGTGVMQTGSTVGELVTGGSTGATALVAQVLTGGASAKLFVNNVVGTFGTETITGSISGVTASLAVANIGILEVAGTTNQQIYSNRVVVFNGHLQAIINNYVIKSWDDTNWTVVLTLPNTLNASETNCHSGLHVFTVNNAPLLGFVWGGASSNNTMFRATSLDGVSWSTAVLRGSIGINGGNPGGVLREIVYQNTLVWFCSYNAGTFVHSSWNPANDVFLTVGASGATGTPRSNDCNDYFIFQNKLLLLASDNGDSLAGIYVFASGVWQRALAFGDTAGATVSVATSGWTLFDPGDGFLYLIYYINNGSGTGWVVRKVSFANNVFTDFGQIQAQFLAGTGIDLFPGGTTASATGRFFVVVDNTTTPGTPQAWIYYAVGDTNGLQYTVASVVLPTASTTVSVGATLPQGTINVVSTTGFPSSGTILVVSSTGVQTIAYTGTTPTSFTGCTGGGGTISIGSRVNFTSPVGVFGQGGDVANVISHTRLGGGERIWGPGQPDMTANLVGPVPTGVLVTFTLPNVSAQIAAASGGASLPQSTIFVGNTYGFPQSGGSILVGVNTTTTIDVSSNGVSLPSSTINVASTAAFPSSGTIFVTTTTGTYAVQYTGKTATSFTGCTGGTGVMQTNGNVVLAQVVNYTGVTSGSFTGCTLGTGSLVTGGLVQAMHNVGFWYSQTGELELAQATIGTASRGTIVVKQINQVPADGSASTVIWIAGPLGDNIANLTNTNLQPSVLA